MKGVEYIKTAWTHCKRLQKGVCMNTERLHAIAIAVIDDINTSNTEATLQKLVKSLENQVNQPQTPEFQKQVSQNLQTLYDALAASKSNDYSPARKQALKELGAHDLFGNNLRDRIQEIFERNQITPAIAFQELQELHTQLAKYKTSFDEVISSFEKLKIGSEQLEKGQCEVGILIPRPAVSNKLKELSNDLDRLDRLFGTFSELTTHKRPGFEIRSVSSSDFNIMLATIPAIAASIAFAVDRILNVYKSILEIRRLHGELKKQGFQDKELQSIKKKADSAITKEIKKLTPELLETYYGKEDTPRRNELSNELYKALIEIAKRIDKGYNVEIRVPTDDSGEDASKDVHINTINAVLKNLEFIQLEGEAILSLPETIKEGNDEKETQEEEQTN